MRLSDGTLFDQQGLPLLIEMAPSLVLTNEPDSQGALLQVALPGAQSLCRINVGRFDGEVRFLACNRDGLYHLCPKLGSEERDVLPETQFLLAELVEDRHLLLVPMVDRTFRSSLWSAGEELSIVAETGDAATVGKEVHLLYVAVGKDPFALMARAARAMMRQYRIERSRADKPLPRSIEQLGYCLNTGAPADWDLLRSVISKLRAEKVAPRRVLVRDRWQQTSDDKLEAFQPEGPDDLAELKQSLALDRLCLAHPILGAASGVSAKAMPEYHAHATDVEFSDGVVHHAPMLTNTLQCELVPPEDIHRFYADFYSALLEAGVDGVEVDHQEFIEGIGDGRGGRVHLKRVFRSAIEGAAHTQFLGDLVNAGACSNELLLFSLSAPLTRILPRYDSEPGCHGRSVYAAAMTSLFVSEFVHPDWGEFASNDDAGAFQAAARALSGGPITICDPAGDHNIDVIRKLVCGDGSVLRPLDPARPTLDSLFNDPFDEDYVLKIFNRNQYGWVVGAFNCQYHEDESRRHFISGGISPEDIPGVTGDLFAVYSHQGRRLTRCPRHGRISTWLAESAFEIATIMPIEHGFAPIGLVDKYNSGAAILRLDLSERQATVELRDAGEFVAYCAHEPLQITVGDRLSTFSYDRKQALIRMAVDTPGRNVISIEF